MNTTKTVQEMTIPELTAKYDELVAWAAFENTQNNRSLLQSITSAMMVIKQELQSRGLDA